MSLNDILNRYADPAQAPHADVEQHFEQAAEQARPEDVGQGVAAALRSNATPTVTHRPRLFESGARTTNLTSRFSCGCIARREIEAPGIMLSCSPAA